MTPRILSPYLDDESALWLKGNLHTHTRRSDGNSTPQEMINHFASLGHDFLQISDHDVMATYDGLDARGMVLLAGTEVCGGCPHMLDVVARRLVNARSDMQAVIDEINRTSGFAVLCHPNWEEDFNHYPYSELLALKNYTGIEIFNGVVTDMPGSHLSTDKWDRLLGAGRLVWGFANDDAHRIPQAGRGWNVVRVKERSAKAILKALKTGNFYASCGVEITRIKVDGPRLHVETANADRIWVVGRNGTRICDSLGGVLDFDASKVTSPYFRVECYGPRGAMAWTQPFAVRGGEHDATQKRLAKLGALKKATLHATRARKAPVLTGRMSDPLWAKAEAFSKFMNIRDGTPAAVGTEIRAIVAAETLFVAVKAQEPQLDAMKVDIDRDGQGGLWTNDGVELFLDVEGRGGNYYHIMANANGYTYGTARGEGKAQFPKLKAKAGRWQGGWIVELAIPLKQLGGKTARGTRYGLHVCRNRYPVSGCYVWSWVGASNHNVAQYGSLIL